MEVEWSNNKKSQTVQHTNVRNLYIQQRRKKSQVQWKESEKEREVAALYRKFYKTHVYLYRLRCHCLDTKKTKSKLSKRRKIFHNILMSPPEYCNYHSPSLSLADIDMRSHMKYVRCNCRFAFVSECIIHVTSDESTWKSRQLSNVFRVPQVSLIMI